MRVSWDDQHKVDERKIDGTATKRSRDRRGEVAKSEAEFINALLEKTVMTDNASLLGGNLLIWSIPIMNKNIS